MLELNASLQILALLVLHWIGDFVFQTSWMATEKSKNIVALIAHVLTYTIILGIGSILLFGINEKTGIFVACNAGLHLVTDYITSRISSKYYAAQNMRPFFVMLGLDQLLHQAALILTLVFLINA